MPGGGPDIAAGLLRLCSARLARGWFLRGRGGPSLRRRLRADAAAARALRRRLLAPRAAHGVA